MSAQPAQENGAHELGGEGKLADPAEVLTINPDDFPGIEGMWEAESLEFSFRTTTIDVNRAVRRARYLLEAYPEAFRNVLKVIAKITSDGKTVTWNKNLVIERYNQAVMTANKQWLEGKEIACPLTRAEMIGLRCCHPRGVIPLEHIHTMLCMGFFSFFDTKALTEFGRFEIDGVTSKKKTAHDFMAISEGLDQSVVVGSSYILFDRSASGAKATGKRVNSRNHKACMSKDPKAGSGKSHRKRDKLQRRLDKLKREKKKLKREKKELKLKRQNDKLKRENDKLGHKDTDLERENNEFEGGRSERKRKSSDLDRELSELESTLKRRASALDSTFTELESKASLLQSKFDQLRQ